MPVIRRTMGAQEPLWTDRREAGQQLAAHLAPWAGRADTSTVVALPRGGVAVAAEVAKQLHLPITTWSVRKLVLPDDPERAIGAVGPGGVELWDEAIQPWLSSQGDWRQQLVRVAKQELVRRQRRYGDATAEDLRGRDLLLVDDGIATGLTVSAAIDSLRAVQPVRLTLAVPVLDRQVKTWLSTRVDGLICLAVMTGLRAVGEHYRHFNQLDDQTVLELLRDCRSQL
jgi:putative phosphoribosyl transferase